VHARYLIVGSSHAGLEALAAIRMHDPEGEMVLATRDQASPYSPTVLPYVVSGRAAPERVALRDEGYFAAQGAQLRRGAALASVDPARHRARFADGSEIEYDRLLLATGAAPALPAVPGLETIGFHVLRTLADATRLRAALGEAKRAVVLGAGLVGMHAAENLVAAGIRTTVLELQPQVLPGYFDAQAAGLIRAAFEQRGARVLLGRAVTAAAKTAGGFALELAGGERLEGELLLVATGVRPAIDYLAGSGIATDRGILVDRRMRTSADGVWAAGDVAQAASFYGGAPVLNGILPSAVEQARIAGMDMAGDPGTKDYRGAVPINAYHFFGRQALSVGVGEIAGGDAQVTLDEATGRYRKIVLKDDRLAGIFSVDMPFDAGVMVELVRRRVDLAPVKREFLAQPRETARALMSRLWR
jgi:phenylglyoxylate dehydrogenase epsilon subunit